MYSKTQIERAMNKISKGQTFKEVAKLSGINIHTLKYYARKSTGFKKVTKATVKRAFKAPKRLPVEKVTFDGRFNKQTKALTKAIQVLSQAFRN